MTQCFPQFLGQMGCIRSQQQAKRFENGTRTRFHRVQFVDERHHLGDGRVEMKCRRVPIDLFDGPVEDSQLFVRRLRLQSVMKLVILIEKQPPYPIQEATRPHQPPGGPRFVRLDRSHEHLVEPQRVSSLIGDDIERIDDITETLGHLAVVFSQDHPLVDQFCVRLVDRTHADVVEELGPEARVEQVPDSMLRPTEIEVDRHPVLRQFWIDQSFIVPGIDEAQEIGARTSTAGHRIEFPRGGCSCPRHLGADPVLGSLQR